MAKFTVYTKDENGINRNENVTTVERLVDAVNFCIDYLYMPNNLVIVRHADSYSDELIYDAHGKLGGNSTN